MISIDELINQFGPTLKIAPWGDCLVIQGTEFNRDWAVQLGDQGYRCHFGDLDRHAVTFVQLKRRVAPGKVVYQILTRFQRKLVKESQKVFGGENKF